MNKQWRRAKRKLELTRKRLEQHRVRKRHEKLKNQERRRRLRELENSNGFLKRLQVWRRARKIKKEKESLGSHERSFLRRHESKLFWSFVALLVAGLAVVLTTELRRVELKARSIEENQRVVATVNDRPIYIELLLERLFYTGAAAMLQELTEQEVIRQFAQEQGVELTAEDREKVKNTLTTDSQWQANSVRMETALLLRRLILREATEEERRDVYMRFQSDLTVYVLEMYRFDDLEEALKVKDVLPETSKQPLDQKLTIFELENSLGKLNAREISRLKPGSFSKPVYLEDGVLVVRLVKVLTEYGDVGEKIDDLIVNGKTREFVFKLMTNSKVESPLLRDDWNALKDDVPGPFATATPVD